MGTCASLNTGMAATLDFDNVTMDEKRMAVLDKIKSEPKVVDLKLTFYMAACEAMSTKAITLVPSPKEYLERRPLEEAVLEANQHIPNLRLLQLYLERPDAFQLQEDALSLLYWLLVGLREPSLRPIPDPKDWPCLRLLHTFSSSDGVRKPDMVLKVCYSTMSAKGMQWRALSGGKKMQQGFTGVRLEEVHGGLHCGARRLARQGYGLTLCSSLGPCLARLRPSWTWGKSCLGTQMSVAMVVEFVDSSHKVEKLGPNPVYYLIPDTNYARIRYLLIWINAPAPRLQLATVRNRGRDIQQLLLSYLLLVSSLFFPKEAPQLHGWASAISSLAQRLFRRH